jgi:hypothetical protein
MSPWLVEVLDQAFFLAMCGVAVGTGILFGRLIACLIRRAVAPPPARRSPRRVCSSTPRKPLVDTTIDPRALDPWVLHQRRTRGRQ